MNIQFFKKNKVQLLLLFFIVFTTFSVTVILQTRQNGRIAAQQKLICPPNPHNKDALQMVGCYVPTDTPIPAKLPNPTVTPVPTLAKVITTVPGLNGKVTTTGPASKCKGTIVSFGAPKKLLLFGYGRPGTCFKPKWIVMHITAGNETTALQVFNYFNSGAGGRHVGTQFAIGKQGDVIQMTQSFTDKFEKAYGVLNFNEGSISIELTQLSVYNSKASVPPKQYAAAVTLVKALMKQYNIPVGPYGYTWKASSDTFSNYPSGVYGHYQFNPLTRTDPGAGFMRDFRKDI
ncbi:MAG TPA: peptidoglycan recognition family protein [Candidatus Sulfotelmatobacter sp.]|jgi:hypothetical protein|nr:peptidoglycan recognition family protein [Candidatus Sulfotelmatobacter sp.]